MKRTGNQNCSINNHAGETFQGKLETKALRAGVVRVLCLHRKEPMQGLPALGDASFLPHSVQRLITVMILCMLSFFLEAFFPVF